MMNMTTYLCIDYRYLKKILVWEVNHMPTWFQNQDTKSILRKKSLSNQIVKSMLVFL